MDSGHHHHFSGFRIEDSALARENNNQAVEMDFFSIEKKMRTVEHGHLDFKVPSLFMTRDDLGAVNTGLHLAANTGRDDHSVVVDDAMSQHDGAGDDKKAHGRLSSLIEHVDSDPLMHESIDVNLDQLAAVQGELQCIKDENQKLKIMVEQLNTMCNALKVKLARMQLRLPDVVDDDKNKLNINEYEGHIAQRSLRDTSPNSSTLRSQSEVGSADCSLHKRRQDKGIVPQEQELNSGKSPGDHGWNPNKAPRLSSPPKPAEQAQDSTMQRARVSVRVRTEATTVPDGCQWRKYGQKTAKGNPCPRAYYRCTMSERCPVRKQVQRCAEDKTILISTYEGTHSHLLPTAAQVMANTTSAAASILLSGSMPSSGDTMMNTSLLARTILPCSPSIGTVSASASFPTVTLDLTLTQNQSALQLQRPPAAQFPVPFPPQLPSQVPQLFGQQVLENQTQFVGLQMPPEMSAAAQLAHEKVQAMLPQSLAENIAALKRDPSFDDWVSRMVAYFMGSASAGVTDQIGSTAGGNGDTSNKNQNQEAEHFQHPGDQ